MRVTTAMRNLADADDLAPGVGDERDREQQHEMYRKTLAALAETDADDENEGVAVVTNWIIEKMEEDGERPSSRAVRRRAREFCRNNGYEIPDDSWLGE